MVCPYCNKQETNVVDSRKNNEGNSIRRRRECPKCNLRFTTYEKAEIGLFVQKRSGELQEFNYEKLYKGIENAFGGLDLNEKQLKTLVDNIFIDIKEKGAKVKSEFIGETVLSHLKEINKVAYLRFASVYLSFDDVRSFKSVIENLEKQPSPSMLKNQNKIEIDE